MRALNSIRRKIEKGTTQVHKARRNAVWLAVASLLIGGKLWPAALGRSRPGKATAKHGIKALNNLLGNTLLYAELQVFYSAILQVLLRAIWKPVILVDITEIRDGICALTASLAHDGRGVPIYALVASKFSSRNACRPICCVAGPPIIPHVLRVRCGLWVLPRLASGLLAYSGMRTCKKQVARRRFKRTFLRGLAKVLPAKVTPILATDAGFQSTWFDDVQEMGWDYVGRVRHKTKFLYDDQWVSCQNLHKKANNQPLDLGTLLFPREKPKARRIVLAKKRKSKGRRRINQKGEKGNTAYDRRCEKSACEPWLLATSLSCPSVGVVDIYGLRMQIEENYRDVKNKRWGWALDHYNSRKALDGDYTRYEILLMIAALAFLVQNSVGCAGESKSLHRFFQANTIRNRRVISLFVLGGFLLDSKHQHRLTITEIVAGFVDFCQRIRALEPYGPT